MIVCDALAPDAIVGSVHRPVAESYVPSPSLETKVRPAGRTSVSTTSVAASDVGPGMFSAVIVNSTCWPIGTAVAGAPDGTVTDLPTAMSSWGWSDVTVAAEELFSRLGSSTTGDEMVAVFTRVPAASMRAVTVAMMPS